MPSAHQAPSTEDVVRGLCQEQAPSHDGRHFLCAIRVQGPWGLLGQSVSSAILEGVQVSRSNNTSPLPFAHARPGKGMPLLARGVASQLQRGGSIAYPP